MFKRHFLTVVFALVAIFTGLMICTGCADSASGASSASGGGSAAVSSESAASGASSAGAASKGATSAASAQLSQFTCTIKDAAMGRYLVELEDGRELFVLFREADATNLSDSRGTKVIVTFEGELTDDTTDVAATKIEDAE